MLRNEASSKLSGVIEESFADMTVTAWKQAQQQALSARMAEVFEAARDRLVSGFSTDASTVLSVHQRRIDALVDSVRRTAAEIFDISFRPYPEHETFELVQEPYWVTESAGSTWIPDPARVIDRFLPSAYRWVRLRARIMRQVNELICVMPRTFAGQFSAASTRPFERQPRGSSNGWTMPSERRRA